jgi:hypothetical protein
MRFQHRAAAVVDDQAYPAASGVDLQRHRGRQADGVLERRLLALTEMDAAVEVEHYPKVRGQRLLEGLAHELLVLL